MKKSIGVLLGILMSLVFTAIPTKAEVIILQQSYTQYQTQAVSFSQAFKKTDGAITYQVSRIVFNPIKNFWFNSPGAQIQVKIYNTSSQTDLRPNISAGSLGESTIAIYPGSYYDGQYSFLFPSPVTLPKGTWYAVVVTNLSAPDPATLNNDGEWMDFRNGYSGTGGDPNVTALFICNDRTLSTCADASGYYASGNGRNTSFTMYGPDPVPPSPPASPLSLRLPFRDGEEWGVSCGYGCGFHTGNDAYALDFNLSGEADKGSPVLVVAHGKVEDVFYCSPNCPAGYGNYVIINHGNGYTSRYAHLGSASVKKGQFVFQGEQIGIVGDSGAPGLYHLHFAMYKDGAAYKPEPMSVYTDFPSCTVSSPPSGSCYISTNTAPVAIYHLDAVDSSGNLNPIAFNPNCFIAACSSFNGTNDYFDAPTSLQLNGDFSIVFWLKPENIGTGRINPIEKAYYGEFSLIIENDGSLSYYHGQSTSNYFSWTALGVSAIANNQAIRVVITRDNASKTLKSYANGSLISTVTYNIDPSTSSNSIRIGLGSTAVPYKGKQDEIAIYPRVLTADEVNNDYYGSKP